MADKMLNLEECRVLIGNFQKLIEQRMNDLPPNSQQALSELSKYHTMLGGYANDLSVGIMNNILTDLDAPGQRIKFVTSKVEKAIQKLQQINKLLGIVSSLVDIFGKIAAAAVSGRQPLVAISSLLDGLENLSAEA